MNSSTSRMLLASCLAAAMAAGVTLAGNAQRAPSMPPGTSPEVVNTYNEGSRAIQSGRVGEAAERFKSVVAAVPQFAPGHTGYGVALAKLGRNGEALAEFEKAYSIMPDDGQTLVQLAQMCGLVGRTNEALKYYKEYLSLYPNGHDAAMMRQNLDILQQETTSSSSPAASPDSSASETGAKAHNTVLRWSQMPITVFIANGAGISGYRAEFQSILTESFNAWANASQGRISFQFVSSPAAALLKCKWTADAKEVATPQEGGHTFINSTPAAIKTADVVILTHDLQQPAVALTENAFRWTCLHEVGHALGLTTHSNQPGDIMFLGATGDRGNALVLSDRDKKTVSLLYSR